MTRFALFSTLAFAPLCFAATNSPALLKSPTLNRTHIVFSYAGDLWSVPRDGGDATRLTTSAGEETHPMFSPDGTQIAFTGEYDGNIDVYTIPAAGGVPKRLTWHPAPDITLGWMPDGSRVLFASPRNSYSRFPELYTAGLNGGLEERVDLPMGNEASYSPDGSQIAYVPLAHAFDIWKHYRGGRTTPIWIATLATGHIQKIPRENSNDFNPMWVDKKIYFLSDRSGSVALFSYDIQSKKVTQCFENTGLDIKSASAGPGAIVYEQFGTMHLYDPKTNKTKPIDVQVTGDLPELREHFVNVSKRLRNPHISPNGARALFEARGEIITVPAEKGDPRNLTNTPGVMERSPVWSPDGKTIAYFSDESGEYQLYLRAQSGMGDPVKMALGEKPAFYSEPVWSPDSKKIAYRDNHLNLWYIDVDAKRPVKVDTDYYFGSAPHAAWSPDSKWLAYSRQLPSHLAAVQLYSLQDAKSTQITDGMSDARMPVFDKDGKYLYFTASTDAGPSFDQDLHSGIAPVTRSVYLAVLSNSDPSPLAPESDDEKVADGKAADSKEEGDSAKKDPPKPDAVKPAVTVKVDLDHIGQRILALPLPPLRYSDLQIGKAGVLLAVESPRTAPGEPPSLIVHRFDLKTRKSDVAIAGVRNFEIAEDGEKMLYRRGEAWTIGTLKPMPPPGAPAPPPSTAGASGDNTLKVESLEVKVDPRREWKQMFHEAWRIERDFFYDPGLHGVDREAIEHKYSPYVDTISSRADLNYIFSEAMGELTVGHLFVVGGDMPDVKRIPTGLLGADYSIQNGRYRFARVYDGENWNPQLKAPLTQPGVNVAAGEYLLAVNGRDLRASDNVYSFFENAAGKEVVLRVGPDASGANAREVTVIPVPNEAGLRNLAWIEDNRRKVDRMTNGRVAYVYMPDTAFGGLTSFTRYFFAQVGKEGVIIDERFNGGGALATDIVEILNRKLLSIVTPREGHDLLQPNGAIFGPKAMIINEYAGSGGDAMPWYFHRTGAGTLVGKRTWGGLVGIPGTPELMDGGAVTAPSLAVWNPDGEFDVENRGIAPDVEVELDPEQVRQGKDPQLEKAVEVVMAQLRKQPLTLPRHPAYPNYHSKTSGTQ